MISHDISLPTKHQEYSEELRAERDKVLAFMRPKPCPFPLVRLGGSTDGAYLVPDDLEGIEACFSPGVSRIKHFEDELLDRYGIPSHMCDKSTDADRLSTPLVKGKQTFQKKWLDINGAEDSVSLAAWTNEMAPGKRDLLLQIDIEGAEYRNIIHTDDDVLRRFRVIIIEIHVLDELNNPNAVEAVFKPFFDALGQSFVCVHAHPNNNLPARHIAGTDTHVPPALELTLLRKDRFEGIDDADLIAPQLPHPQDISRNIVQKPPSYLDDSWMLYPASQASVVKRLEDQIDYHKHLKKARDNTDRIQREKLPPLLAQLITMLGRTAAFPAVPPQGELTNVARGKPFRLNGALGNHPTSGVVEARAPFFFHSALLPGPTITIDLQDVFQLHEITVANRADKLFDRAGSLFAIVHEGEDPYDGHAVYFGYDQGFLSGQVPEISQRLPGVKARYVTLTCPVRTTLHLADVRVMGTPVAPAARGWARFVPISGNAGPGRKKAR